MRNRIEENSGGRKNRTIIQNGRVSTEIYFYFTTPFSIYHTTPHNTHPFHLSHVRAFISLRKICHTNGLATCQWHLPLA